jgi:hypothetical protein
MQRFIASLMPDAAALFATADTGRRSFELLDFAG